MNWKKEIRSWGIMLSVLAVLYFAGWITPLMGGLQSLALATGVIKPDIDAVPSYSDFDFNGRSTVMNGQKIELKEYKGKALF